MTDAPLPSPSHLGDLTPEEEENSASIAGLTSYIPSEKLCGEICLSHFILIKATSSF